MLLFNKILYFSNCVIKNKIHLLSVGVWSTIRYLYILLYSTYYSMAKCAQTKCVSNAS